MVAARAAGPQASMAIGGWPSGTMSQNASPPIPFMCGYATAMEEAVVGGRVARAESVGERRREQREDLSPAEEDYAREDHEDDRVVARHEPQEHGHCFEAEGDGHRVLASEVVRNPAEERTREPV